MGPEGAGGALAGDGGSCSAPWEMTGLRPDPPPVSGAEGPSRRSRRREGSGHRPVQRCPWVPTWITRWPPSLDLEKVPQHSHDDQHQATLQHRPWSGARKKRNNDDSRWKDTLIGLGEDRWGPDDRDQMPGDEGPRAGATSGAWSARERRAQGTLGRGDKAPILGHGTTSRICLPNPRAGGSHWCIRSFCYSGTTQCLSSLPCKPPSGLGNTLIFFQLLQACVSFPGCLLDVPLEHLPHSHALASPRISPHAQGLG